MLEVLGVVLVAFWVISYGLYPAVALYMGQRIKPMEYSTPAEWPELDIVIAARNESSVIQEKLLSILQGNYPIDKLTIWVGSDASTDGTDALVESLASAHPQIQLKRFNQRSGKSGVLNALLPEGTAPIVVLTDANVMFTPQTLVELIAPFSSENIGLSGGTITPQSNDYQGVGESEATYLNLENRLRMAESAWPGYPMAVEGGCFALRRALFTPIPPRWLVEDFYLALHVYLKGYKGAFQHRALCYEEVNPGVKDQYDRKVRIAQGNFTNLRHFALPILRYSMALNWAFWGHKGLRWMAPVTFPLLVPVALILALDGGLFWQFLVMLLCLMAILGAFDLILLPKHTFLKPVRMVRHFMHMNLAMFTGFIRYRKGVKSNVWEPTKR